MANVSYNFGSATFTPTIKEATNKQVLSLDGIDGYLEIPDSNAIDFAANQNFTIESWLKIDPSQSATGSIFEKWSAGGGYPYTVRYDGTTAKSLLLAGMVLTILVLLRQQLLTTDNIITLLLSKMAID